MKKKKKKSCTGSKDGMVRLECKKKTIKIYVYNSGGKRKTFYLNGFILNKR